jgi:hypothetical protein
MNYKVVWHDGGCLVSDPDGRTMAFKGRRYTAQELTGKSRAEIARLPGALWPRFRRD